MFWPECNIYAPVRSVNTHARTLHCVTYSTAPIMHPAALAPYSTHGSHLPPRHETSAQKTRATTGTTASELLLLLRAAVAWARCALTSWGRINRLLLKSAVTRTAGYCTQRYTRRCSMQRRPPLHNMRPNLRRPHCRRPCCAAAAAATLLHRLRRPPLAQGSSGRAA
jgi:hypothetical protein